MPKSRALYLVDGSGQFHRAYFAIRGLRTSRGLPTGATFGFTTMLRKLLADEQPEWIGIAIDPPGPTFRHEQFGDYKANRPKMDDDLAVQIPYVRRVCEAFRLPVLELPGFEADDVIATLAREAVERGHDVVVVSSDKDLLQLVSPRVRVLSPGREGGPAVLYDREQVIAKWGVPPERIGDVLALVGDAVDNVPGVPGIGEKGARDLVAQYGSLEAVLEHAAEVKRASYRQGLLEHRESALLSRQLVALDEHVPVALDLEALLLKEPDRAAARALFTELEFAVLAREFAPAPAEGAGAGGRAGGERRAPGGAGGRDPRRGARGVAPADHGPRAAARRSGRPGPGLAARSGGLRAAAPLAPRRARWPAPRGGPGRPAAPARGGAPAQGGLERQTGARGPGPGRAGAARRAQRRAAHGLPAQSGPAWLRPGPAGRRALRRRALGRSRDRGPGRRAGRPGQLGRLFRGPAAAGRGAPAPATRGGRAAAGARHPRAAAGRAAGGDGAGRGQGRRGVAAHHEPRDGGAARAAHAGDPRPGRGRVQRQLAGPAARGAVRAPRPEGWQEDRQDARRLDRRGGAGGAGRAPRAAAPHPRLPRGAEAQVDLRRRPARAGAPPDRAYPCPAQPDRGGHGPALDQRPQPAEHPHPHGRGPRIREAFVAEPATCCSRPTTARSSCASWPTCRGTRP